MTIRPVDANVLTLPGFVTAHSHAFQPARHRGCEFAAATAHTFDTFLVRSALILRREVALALGAP